MKKNDIVEYLGFEDEKPKVGRPKLADKNTKKKSLIIASLSFAAVTLLLIFGYGTLFGFKNMNLRGSLTNTNEEKNISITEIRPLIKDVTLKVGTARKVYLTVLPASATNKNIEYKSSDKSVAIVDNNGKVTALSEGNSTITASSTDGSLKSAKFNITVIKNAGGNCTFTSLGKVNDNVDYTVSCENAKIKEIQYKVGDDNFKKLLTKKANDSVPFSEEQLKEKITFKVVYYPNNSKITKYSTRSISTKKTTTQTNGSCTLTIKEVKKDSAKYDINCDNASVSKIAYKIGNGSYVGIDNSSLADTILFVESDVTRILYFNVEYKIDGSDRVRTLTKSSIIEKGVQNPNMEGEL